MSQLFSGEDKLTKSISRLRCKVKCVSAMWEQSPNEVYTFMLARK